MVGEKFVTPQIGDFAVVKMHNTGGKLIEFGQYLNGGFSDYQHAIIYIGNGQIVEAEPGGAVISQLSRYDRNDILWSTGRFSLTDAQRNAIVLNARSFVQTKTPYSAADYFAIASHTMHLPGSSLLKNYVESSKHMICSQLVDKCYEMANFHLFQDGRWPGYVTPADLAHLIGGV